MVEKKFLLLSSILVVIAILLLATTASGSFEKYQYTSEISEHLALVDEQCIRVATVGHSVFLPLIIGGQGASSTVPKITEDTNGCLKFVGEPIHFTFNVGEVGGTAKVDIGDVHQGILLYDDGSNGDEVPNDGIYELEYETTSEDITRSSFIIGQFTSQSGRAESPSISQGRVTITDWEAGESSVAPALSNEIDADTGVEYAAGRLVAVFKQDASFEQVLSILDQYGLTLASWLPKLMSFEGELQPGQDYEVLEEQLMQEVAIEAVERNYAMELYATPTVFLDEFMPVGQSNYLNRIRAKLGWEITRGDPAIKVAVIDSGIKEDHPDFQGQIEGYYICLILCDFKDKEGHGTEVAGFIGAEHGTQGISGLASGTKLLIFKKGARHGIGVSKDITDATDFGARVINISSGRWSSGPKGWTYERAVEYANEQNVVLIAAAGNGGGPIQKEGNCGPLWIFCQWPASFNEVLAVGATKENDTRREDTNWGAQVVYAPGTNLFTTTIDGESYGFKSGTSYAAPQVAALSALILSVNPGLTNDQVVDIIIQTADDMSSDPGFGRINVYRALKVASGETDPGPDPLPDAVTGLQTSVEGSNAPYVRLDWEPPASDYAGVHIYRKDESKQHERLLLEGGVIAGSSYEDHDVEGGRQYRYYVFAVDETGQESIGYMEASESFSSSILISETASGRVIEMDKNSGEILWQVSGYGPNCAYRLESGNTLICSSISVSIVEVDPGGSIVWATTVPDAVVINDAKRLTNGNTLVSVVDNTTLPTGRVVEIAPNGNIVWTYSGLYWPFEAERLPSGNTLMVDGTGIVREVSSSGTLVWYVLTSNWARSVQRLPNGNTLVGESTKIEEFDNLGNLVWAASGYGRIGSVDRMPNGNTLAADADNGRIIEITPAGTISWEKADLKAPWSARLIISN